jgi:hypothetical protein
VFAFVIIFVVRKVPDHSAIGIEVETGIAEISVRIEI